MNVYQKLQEARIRLQSQQLKKSGNNKFAGYSYFELGDFLPAVNQIFADLGLCSIVSFSKDYAELRVVNIDKPDEAITFASPMADAMLKGCHPIQNLGAVETYSRRYLYVSALEIVEHDALDSSEPIRPSAKHVELAESRKKISTSYAETLSDERKHALTAKASEIASLWADSADIAVREYVEFRDNLDTDEQAAFKHFLDEADPKLRNALLKHYKAMNEKAA